MALGARAELSPAPAHRRPARVLGIMQKREQVPALRHKWGVQYAYWPIVYMGFSVSCPTCTMDMASMHIGPFRIWDFPILEEKGQYAYWHGPYAKWGVQYAYWTFMKSSMHIGHFSMSSLHTGLHEIQYANWMSSMHMGPVFKWGPTYIWAWRESREVLT